MSSLSGSEDGWCWRLGMANSPPPDVHAGLGNICLLVLTGPGAVGDCVCCSTGPVNRSIPGAGGRSLRGCPCGMAFQSSPLNI